MNDAPNVNEGPRDLSRWIYGGGDSGCGARGIERDQCASIRCVSPGLARCSHARGSLLAARLQASGVNLALYHLMRLVSCFDLHRNIGGKTAREHSACICIF